MASSTPKSDLTAGTCAGAANILVGFPFDTLKVRLQAERGVYRGAWQCLMQILRYEGVRAHSSHTSHSQISPELTSLRLQVTHGLYRGLSPPLIGGALETGINYFVSLTGSMHLGIAMTVGVPSYAEFSEGRRSLSIGEGNAPCSGFCKSTWCHEFEFV